MPILITPERGRLKMGKKEFSQPECESAISVSGAFKLDYCNLMSQLSCEIFPYIILIIEQSTIQLIKAIFSNLFSKIMIHGDLKGLSGQFRRPTLYLQPFSLLMVVRLFCSSHAVRYDSVRYDAVQYEVLPTYHI